MQDEGKVSRLCYGKDIKEICLHLYQGRTANLACLCSYRILVVDWWIWESWHTLIKQKDEKTIFWFEIIQYFQKWCWAHVICADINFQIAEATKSHFNTDGLVQEEAGMRPFDVACQAGVFSYCDLRIIWMFLIFQSVLLNDSDIQGRVQRREDFRGDYRIKFLICSETKTKS